MIILIPSININIRLIGFLEPGSDAPAIADLANKEEPLFFSPYSHQQNTATFGDRIDSWRRKSGIPRPNSASRASIAAATVCRSLIEVSDWNSARLGVVTASTTSAAWSAVNFETRGLTEAWNAVDPLLLPSTLLSAVATQIAMAVGARGFAISCVVGLLGVFHAIEGAILGLERGDADVVLVVASEEQTPIQCEAHNVLGWIPTPGEFAGAIALERETARGFRVAFVGYGNSCNASVPDDWDAATRFEIETPNPGPSMQNSSAFRAISAALLAKQPRVIVTGYVPGLGCASVGFEIA